MNRFLNFFLFYKNTVMLLPLAKAKELVHHMEHVNVTLIIMDPTATVSYY